MRNDKFLKMENIHWFVFEEAVFSSTPYMFLKSFKIKYNLFALLPSKAQIFIYNIKVFLFSRTPTNVCECRIKLILC